MESTRTSAQHIVGAQESVTDARVAFGDGAWHIVGVRQTITDTSVAFGDGICQSRSAVWSPAIIARHCCVTPLSRGREGLLSACLAQSFMPDSLWF